MNVNRQQVLPVSVPRSRRNHGVSVLTSMPAGKMVPVAAIPMLREESLSATIRCAVEMLETREMLLNAVNVRFTAYVVPLLALARFEGSRDQFDRSYMGQPQIEGGAVIPFFETDPYGTYGANAVYKALGLHGEPTEEVNTAYLEAYNLIWNFRARNRSKEITPRGRLTDTLAPAFWEHSRFRHVLPDFDQAVIDGEVALNLVDLALTGSAPITGAGAVAANGTLVLADPSSPTTKFGYLRPPANISAGTNSAINLHNSGSATISGGGGAIEMQYKSGLTVSPGTLAADLSAVVAELTGAGVTLSLSNLELAKKTVQLAKMRERYEGLDDDWVIDMLMSGLHIPDKALTQPILLADVTQRVVQAKRYATDAANLAQSAVSGGAMADLRLRVPRLDTGGVVMVFAEAVPEQLFERQRDPFFVASDVADLPEWQNDYLDPEKVVAVTNGFIDSHHSTPNGVFGYAPLNWEWNAFGPRVGGKFLRPNTDPVTDTVRQRIWAMENSNPTLSADFYIVSSLHTKPFLDTAVDPFEIAAAGNAVIDGNTVFGGVLAEATGNYDAVAAKAPTERIVQA